MRQDQLSGGKFPLYDKLIRASPIFAIPLFLPVRFLIKFLFFLMFALGAVAGAAWWWAHEPIDMTQSPVDFRIVPGSGLKSAIGQMREAGIVIEPNLLRFLARLGKAETTIKAGSYSVQRGVTPLDLLGKLTRGEVTQGELTLVEGWSFRQWRSRMDRHPDLGHDSLGMSETEIAQRLGVPGERLEGWLFPDTYLFDKHSSDFDLMARALRAMRSKLETEWNGRADNLPYRNPQEALIMASIVEKETGRAADRGQVAAVFVNRLRKGMLLQTDPTVIYGLGERFDGNLRKQDLLGDTPYNTYTRAGLPPTPIAMPGQAALRAALHPENSEALYFVARGDGSSEFSRTLDEHNRAVNKYQRGGK